MFQDFLKNIRPPVWPNGLVGQEYAPPDTPVCGFLGELCKDDSGKYEYTHGGGGGGKQMWNVNICTNCEQ